tara:strand:- start:754 stop:2025 length:1272 start_codon:yes stop_codon:yes gene_type:complete
MSNREKMNIAVIGSGVSGLVSSLILSRKHNITIFEKCSYLGGHVHTHKMKDDDGVLNVDSGFIVYNENTYPNFIKLMKLLNVETQNTSMGFSYSDGNDFEYSGNSINSLFAKKTNFVSLNFYLFIYNILKFNKIALKDLDNLDINVKLIDYLKTNKISKELIEKYIIPMGSAIWSTDPETMKDMPARFFIRFFKNHGLLDVRNRPQWKVIKNGSFQYVKKIYKELKKNNAKIFLNHNVKEVSRVKDKVIIKIKGKDEIFFDKVIFACHSNQALQIIKNITPEEKNILSNIKYQNNTATIHTDTNILPRRKKAWSSWNYLSVNKDERVVLTYNMNILQGLKSKNIFCVTINDPGLIEQGKIIKTINYSHPLFSESSVTAQSQKDLINGKNNTFFSGAYWGYGFHEDGVNSALDVCNYFNMSLNG